VVVGVIVWELEVFGAQSLKDKRRVVKSLKERLQSRFKVSAAETRHQDLWQRAEIAACVVAGEQRHVTRSWIAWTGSSRATCGPA
jgi:uncharacterized protein